jgi:hypothetical protein
MQQGYITQDHKMIAYFEANSEKLPFSELNRREQKEVALAISAQFDMEKMQGFDFADILQYCHNTDVICYCLPTVGEYRHVTDIAFYVGVRKYVQDCTIERIKPKRKTKFVSSFLNFW